MTAIADPFYRLGASYQDDPTGAELPQRTEIDAIKLRHSFSDQLLPLFKIDGHFFSSHSRSKNSHTLHLTSITVRLSVKFNAPGATSQKLRLGF